MSSKLALPSVPLHCPGVPKSSDFFALDCAQVCNSIGDSALDCLSHNSDPSHRITTLKGREPYSVRVRPNWKSTYRNGNIDCDVLVVGAGPTGLTLSAALAASGRRVTTINRQAESANTSRELASSDVD